MERGEGVRDVARQRAVKPTSREVARRCRSGSVTAHRTCTVFHGAPPPVGMKSPALLVAVFECWIGDV